MDVSVEVRTAVNEAKKRVKSCETAQEVSDVILQFLPLLDTSSSKDSCGEEASVSSQDLYSSCSIPCNFEFREEFISRHYSNFSEHILIHSDPQFLQDENFKQILTRLYLEGPAGLSFLALVSSLTAITHTDKLHTVVSILDNFMSSNKFTELFLAQCMVDAPTSLAQELLTAITSLPDKLSNKMKLALNGKFHPNVYYEMLGGEILKALTKVHEIACRTRDFSIKFLSNLIGKIALRGSASTILDVLLPQLKEWCYISPLWSNICSRLLVEAPESSLEAIIECLLKKITFYPFFCKIMRDSVLTNAIIKHLVTHKFLLVRFYNGPNILQNIIGYLSGGTRREVLVDVVKTMLNHWSNTNSVKYSSYEQHFYITQAIILAVMQLDETEITEHRNELLHRMLNGVQAHLDNPNNKIRQLGMIVAECMTLRLHPDAQKLQFEIEEDDDVRKLRALVASPKFGSEIEKENFLNQENIVVSDGLEKTVAGHSSKGDSHVKQPLLGNQDEDNDDDLEPFEMSEGDNDLIEGIRPPRYISQCIDGLLSNDDPKRHIASLRVLRNVVKSDVDNLNHQCVQVITILLHLQDKYSLEDYNELRFAVMVEILTRCPIPVADYLTKEFYAQNYSLRQRMDILDVLAATAAQLSKPETNTDVPTTHVNVSEVPETKNWKAVVQERIEKKTRRFSKKSSIAPPKATANRFSNVAGHFFFPLLQGFDNHQNTFDLLGKDCLVLGSLVCTLGNIMYCARGTLVAQNMARSLLEFLWLLRYHSDAHVRQGLLFSLAMVVVSVPGFFLMTEVQDEIAECQSWLEHVLHNDTSSQCRELALQVLVSIRDVFQKHFTSDLN